MKKFLIVVLLLAVPVYAQTAKKAAKKAASKTQAPKLDPQFAQAALEYLIAARAENNLQGEAMADVAEAKAKASATTGDEKVRVATLKAYRLIWQMEKQRRGSLSPQSEECFSALAAQFRNREDKPLPEPCKGEKE